VVDRHAFDAWWRAHAQQMRSRAGGVSSEELDSDVDTAISEVREERARRT
jgi:hypothetical protein